ncbi:hypothetical protein HDK64DRAFT_268522 [Phyllosticta capitalensis]
MLLNLGGSLFNLPLVVIQLPQDVCYNGLISLISLPGVIVGLLLLLLILLDFRVDSTALIEFKALIVGSLLSLHFQLFVVSLVLQTPRDLLNEPCQVLGGLRRDCLHISLENQKVSCFDEDVFRLERLVVLFGCHNSVVYPVLALTLVGNGALPFLLVARVILVDGHDPGSLRIVALAAALSTLIV